MKLKNIFRKLVVKLAVVAAIAGACITAKAQGDFDFYALNKEVVLIQITNYAFSAAPSTITTNTNTIDLGGGRFIGSAYVNIWCTTNASTNTLTFIPQTSPDLTNWTSVTYAIATITTNTYTNTLYSGNTTGALLSTNSEVNPFTVVTPVAVTAGFATPYSLPTPFTNTGAFTPNFLAENRLGIQNVADLNRYFRLLSVGTGTNAVAASFAGRRR
jgi:hypothetical protein